MWKTYDTAMIPNNNWNDSAENISTPVQAYFLKLAARCILPVNHQCDEDGLTYANNYMVMTGLERNTNVLWQTSQLMSHRQRIITNYNVILTPLIRRQFS